MAARGLWGQHLAFALLLRCACTTWADSLKTGSIYIRDGHCSFVEGERRDAAAFGSFHSSEGTKSGWAQLYVETSARYSDEEQMRAAGYLEGVLTAYEISAHHLNMESFFDIKTEAPAQWLLEQDAWSRGQVAANKSDFWATLGLLLEQHSGMMEGYWAAANESASRDGRKLPQMSVADFLKLSAVGERPPAKLDSALYCYDKTQLQGQGCTARQSFPWYVTCHHSVDGQYRCWILGMGSAQWACPCAYYNLNICWT